MIYTGPIDEFFEYEYGKLPYRSIDFKFQTLEIDKYQETATVNFPNEHLYTRVTEFKQLTGQQHHQTTIVFEYPNDDGDPYYPVPKPENTELLNKYRTLIPEVPNTYFVGRLATYRYYNMDQVIAQALALFKKLTPAHEEKLPYGERFQINA
jgi:UDP-galactopyranose mutase